MQHLKGVAAFEMNQGHTIALTGQCRAILIAQELNDRLRTYCQLTHKGVTLELQH